MISTIAKRLSILNNIPKLNFSSIYFFIQHESIEQVSNKQEFKIKANYLKNFITKHITILHINMTFKEKKF
jgi:hypothetical protein